MPFPSLPRIFSPVRADAAIDWHSTEPWVSFGMKVVGLLFVALAVAALLPINGAVISSGTVSIEGEYKSVQHLEGGIVADIRVRNGDTVKAGDVLVRLDNTDLRVVGMLGHPFGGHEDIGIRVTSHGFGFSSPLGGLVVDRTSPRES